MVRRAETMWHDLKGGGSMPSNGAVAQFLGGHMAGHALVMRLDGPADPLVVFAGQSLQALAQILPGPLKPDARLQAGLPERLADLALRAVANGAPTLLDSDYDQPAGSPRKPQLLLRAIALPFADASGGHSVAIIASWRKLLSAGETAALHRELAAAIDWMHGGCS